MALVDWELEVEDDSALEGDRHILDDGLLGGIKPCAGEIVGEYGFNHFSFLHSQVPLRVLDLSSIYIDDIVASRCLDKGYGLTSSQLEPLVFHVSVEIGPVALKWVFRLGKVAVECLTRPVRLEAWRLVIDTWIE